MRFPTQAARWAALLVSSGLLSWALERGHIPAAYLLGPMLIGIVFGAAGIPLRLPRVAFYGAQAIVGCLVAHAISAAILLTILKDWLPMLAVVTTTVLAGGVSGWVTGRLGKLPGSTAAWGSSPGAATAMVAMAGDFGADVRLVAFMQYLRLVLVVTTASFVSSLLAGGEIAPVAPAGPEGGALDLIETLAVAGGGAFVGRKLRIPSGAMLVPLVLGAVLKGMGLIDLVLPSALLAVAYAGLGWYIGLQFNRSVIAHAFRALPGLILAVVLLMALCGLSAWMLTALMGTSPLTAYLATSPGGLDSVTIIAVGSKADVPFVLALQTLRLFAVILTGPAIAKFICRRL